MNFEDLTREEIKNIMSGNDSRFPNDLRLGSGADGVVYQHPSDSNKVIKFGHSSKGAYKNEIDNLFSAQLSDLEVPHLHESSFYPDNRLKYEGISDNDTGHRYMVMDKVDFDRGEYPGQEKGVFRKAQALSRLYNQGIDHNDTHGGNIVYNVDKDEPYLLDFSRARKLDKGIAGLGIRDRNVQRGLTAAGDLDISRTYTGIANELSQEAFGSQDPEDIKRYREFIDLAEEGLEKTEYTGAAPEKYSPPAPREDVDWSKLRNELNNERIAGNLQQGKISRVEDVPVIARNVYQKFADGLQDVYENPETRSRMAGKIFNKGGQLLKSAANSIKKHALPELGGGLLGIAADKDIAHSLGRGDYNTAGQQAAVNFGTGAVSGAALSAAAPALMSNPITATAGAALLLQQGVDSSVAYRGGQQGRSFAEQKSFEQDQNASQFAQAMPGVSKGYRIESSKQPQKVMAVLNGKEGHMMQGDPSSFRMANWSPLDRRRYYGGGAVGDMD